MSQPMFDAVFGVEPIEALAEILDVAGTISEPEGLAHWEASCGRRRAAKKEGARVLPVHPVGWASRSTLPFFGLPMGSVFAPADRLDVIYGKELLRGLTPGHVIADGPMTPRISTAQVIDKW